MKKSIKERLIEFIEVLLAIWVADGLVKQIEFLSGLDNLGGLIIVSGVSYVILDYLKESILSNLTKGGKNGRS